MTDIIQEKTSKIDAFSSKSNNKIVYLLLVEDLASKPTKRAFVGAHLIESASSVLFKGYEISWSDRDKITGFDVAIESANEYNDNDRSKIVEVKYPWCRVIRIQNVTYKNK